MFPFAAHVIAISYSGQLQSASQGDIRVQITAHAEHTRNAPRPSGGSCMHRPRHACPTPLRSGWGPGQALFTLKHECGATTVHRSCQSPICKSKCKCNVNNVHLHLQVWLCDHTYIQGSSVDSGASSVTILLDLEQRTRVLVLPQAPRMRVPLLYMHHTYAGGCRHRKRQTASTRSDHSPLSHNDHTHHPAHVGLATLGPGLGAPQCVPVI